MINCQNLLGIHGTTAHEDGRPIEIYNCASEPKFCTDVDHGLMSGGKPIQVCGEACPFFTKEPPLVSCILATYNMPARLEVLNEAVESFLRQDYPNKELIVVIDGDQKLEGDYPSIRVFNCPVRFTTLGDKLNFAIAQTKGEFIARFDDDDISLPTRLSRQVEVIKLADYVTTGEIWTTYGGEFLWQKQGGYGHSQGMFRRSVFDQVGGYAPLSGNEDADIHTRLLKYRHAVDSTPTVIYRWDDGLQHLSGVGSPQAMQAFYAKAAASGIAGTYQICPKWLRDYPSLIRCATPTLKVKLPKRGGSVRPPTKLCVVGFPSKYGGADTELDHQLTVWRAMGVEVSLIPTGTPDAAQLSLGVAERGCTIHEPKDWSKAAGCHVISYCNGDFLVNLEEIRKYARSTTFVNCMTWLFDNEKAAHQRGWIDFFLYQTDHARLKVEGMLKAINPNFRWAKVKPYFDATAYPFIEQRDESVFSFCRVSRDDFYKYSSNQFLIYEAIKAPVPKKGTVLGITDRIYTKTGQPPEFVECLRPGGRPPQMVYAEAQCLIQNCDTYENLPRVAMEAMSMGCVPIVDNRGGWAEIVTHGETGFLCANSNEFVESAETLANAPELRRAMSRAARERILGLYGFDAVVSEWQAFFDRLEEFAPPAPEPMMSPVQQAKSFLAVTGQTVLNQMRGLGGLLPESAINDRLAICQGCEHLGRDGKCGKCGCTCDGRREWSKKLAHPSAKCPVNKW